jgi:hypothetical protein
MPDTADFTVTDLPSFMIGIFWNVLELEHQRVRSHVAALHGIDPDGPDPDLRRALAETAVNHVLGRFPPPANGDLEARRADFIRILEGGFVPDPKPGPRLRSV